MNLTELRWKIRQTRHFIAANPTIMSGVLRTTEERNERGGVTLTEAEVEFDPEQVVRLLPVQSGQTGVITTPEGRTVQIRANLVGMPDCPILEGDRFDIGGDHFVVGVVDNLTEPYRFYAALVYLGDWVSG